MADYSKEKYERLIEESLLFQLNKEEQPSAYRKEALKLVENLYCYLMAINSANYEPFGVEIVDVAKRCIANYNPESGNFLHYFNKSWSSEYSHIIGREIVKNTFGGLHFTEEEERSFRRFMKLVQSMGVDANSSEFDQKIADAMGISIEAVSELKKMSSSKPTTVNVVSSEGEEYSLIEQIDSGIYTDTSIYEQESVIKLVDLITDTFEALQNRQKEMMRKLITSRIALLVAGNKDVQTYVMKQPFFDEEIYVECVRRGEMVQARELSEMFGVNEASTSRSWKAFKEKLSCNLKGE